MTEKIVIPPGLVEATVKFRVSRGGRPSYDSTKAYIDFVLEWLSDNPITPNEAQAMELCAIHQICANSGWRSSIEETCRGWQRRMFIAYEPEVSKRTKKLIKQTVH